MGDPPFEPVRLTILYEPRGAGLGDREHPCGAGTVSAGRNQQKARENVLDALRLILGPSPDVPATHVRVEQVDIRLDVVRAHDRGHAL